MNRELLDSLSRYRDEERDLLGGTGQVKKELYTNSRIFTVDSRKMMEDGRLISVRTHTRFVRFPRHNHNYIEVCYVCQGSITHMIEGERVMVRRGELLFLNQHISHEILEAGESDIAINLIVLPEFFDVAMDMLGGRNVLADFLVTALREKNGVSQYLYFQVADNLQIQNLMENMIYSLIYRQRHEERLNQYTMGLLFLHLLSEARNMKSGNPNSYENMIAMTTLNYIRQSYKTASLTELCEMLGASMSALSRIIKKETGYTFKELLQGRRFTKAIQYLEDSSLPVNDIVSAVGYENNSYFFRKFNEKYGMTPKEYRMRHRGEDCHRADGKGEQSHGNPVEYEHDDQRG